MDLGKNVSTFNLCLKYSYQLASGALDCKNIQANKPTVNILGTVMK